MAKTKKKKVQVKKRATKKVPIKNIDSDEVFRQICYEYATLHPGDLTLAILLDDPLVARAVVSWPNVRREIQIQNEQSQNPWTEMWFDREGWMEMANVPKLHQERVMKTVIKNDLVYADGTMPDASRAFLLTRAREIMNMPQPTGG